MEQPIKFITVVMEQATSTMDYMTRQHTNKVGHAIILNSDGFGEIQESPNAKTDVKPVVGVMLESFPQAGCQTKILTQGVAEMPTVQAIKAGDRLYAYDGKAYTSATITVSGAVRYNPYLGIAMTSAGAGEWVSVLIK